MSEKIGRRDAARRALTVLGAAAIVPSALLACGGEEGGGELNCEGTEGLQANAIQMRQQQAYTDDSPHADKRCDNCNFYQAPTQSGGCGSCTVLLNSPVHPAGYCNLWAAAS